MPDTTVGRPPLPQPEVPSMPIQPISRRVATLALAALVSLIATGCSGLFDESGDAWTPPPSPTPTVRLTASSFSGLHDYQFVRMSDTTWKRTWAELTSSFDGALTSGEGRTVKDTDGNIIGVAVVATPGPEYTTTQSALYGLIDAEEKRAADQERPTFRLSVGGQASCTSPTVRWRAGTGSAAPSSSR